MDDKMAQLAMIFLSIIGIGLGIYVVLSNIMTGLVIIISFSAWMGYLIGLVRSRKEDNIGNED
jgi:hypothetical protein